MSTITFEQQSAIEDKLSGLILQAGMGDKHSACSIAAINIALTGCLTDEIPECMSRAVGYWIITVQDAMPNEMRNSPRWKILLPLAAGTGRDHEKERLALILDWMWGVLPALQPLANEKGFGSSWQRMTAERTADAASAARAAAREAGRARAVVAAARAARYAERAANCASAAAGAAAWPKASVVAACLAAADIREAAQTAAMAASRVALVVAGAWGQLSPCRLLVRLIVAGKAN